MKITVIIPIYNVEQYIIDCLNSVAAQTYEGDLECILVDDCGKDKSMALVNNFIESYRGKITFKILHHERNCGLSAARNTGMDEATGDYIFFLDSDDELKHDCLEYLAQPLKTNDYDLVIGDYIIKGIKWNKLELLYDKNEAVVEENIIPSYMTGKWPAMAWGKLYSRKFILSNKLCFKEGLIHEDELWNFEVACVAKSVFIVKKEIYVYNLRENSIMTLNTIEKRSNAMMTVLEEMYQYADSKKLLNNKYVHVKMENVRLSILNLVRNEKSLFYKYYREQNKIVHKSWIKCFCFNARDWKKQLIDLHLLFPAEIGARYLYAVISYMNRSNSRPSL